MRTLFLLVLVIFSTGLFGQTLIMPDGNGSAVSPYEISSTGNLLWLQAADTAWHQHYIQLNDLSLSGQPWTGIGTLDNPFTGTYNAMGHSISGMVINAPQQQRKGLFGIAVDAKISNLQLINAEVTAADRSALAIGSSVNSRIQNVHVEGNVIGVHEHPNQPRYMGGLIGHADDETLVAYCSANVGVNGFSNIGALIGLAGSDSEIRYSWASGSATSESGSVGGLIGRLGSGALIADSYANASASGSHNTGGLVGSYNLGRSITRCYATGHVSGTSDTGGLVGTSNINLTADHSFYNTETTDQTTSAGGEFTFGLTTAQMQQVDTWESFNHLIAWNISEGSYPTLQDLSVYEEPIAADLASLEGDGSLETPYLITTAAELDAIRQDLAAHYRITNDIDLTSTIMWDTGRGWLPIGTDEDDAFTGTLDGQHFVLNNLHINRPKGDYIGFFGVSDGADIGNLGFADANLLGSQDTGTLLGKAKETSIRNIEITTRITSPKRFQARYTGGCVGDATSSIISNVFIDAFLRGNNSSLGGVVGRAGNETEILYCRVVINAKGNEGNKGGVAGNLGTGAVLTDCHSSGQILSLGNTVGGVVGSASFVRRIARSVSNAIVEAPEGSVGGVIGSSNSTDVTYNCYWDFELSGTDLGASGQPAIFPLTTEEMLDPLSFKGFDFENVWQMSPTSGSPELQTFYVHGSLPDVSQSLLQGSGTSEDPYIIETLVDLLAMHEGLQANYQLGNSIDASETLLWDFGRGWRPVGNADAIFSGNIDGAGFTISGLRINRPDFNNNGLIGYASDSEIMNVHIINANIHGREKVGIILGFGENLTINDCSAHGTVMSTLHSTGGLGGEINSSVVSLCNANAHIWGRLRSGALFGILGDGSEATQCYSNGHISGVNQIGGLIGSLSQSATVLSDSYSRADVHAENTAGGLVGHRTWGSILRCYSTGRVTSDQNNEGGLIGSTFSGSTELSYWDIETSEAITSQGGNGVMPRTTDDMTYTYGSDTYIEWDFENIWTHDVSFAVNDGYPIFQYQLEQISFPVLLTASPLEAGELTGEGDFFFGNTVTVTASPNQGWEFVEWVDENSNTVSTDAEYSFEMPAAAVLLTANFIETAPTNFELSLIAMPSDGGSVSGEGTYPEGSVVTLLATENSGWEFVHWMDAEENVISESPEYDFTMPGQNTDLVAVFEIIISIELIEELEVAIYPNPFRDILNIALEDERINYLRVYDASGHVAWSGQPQTSTLDLSHLADGMYMIFIETEKGTVSRQILKQ